VLGGDNFAFALFLLFGKLMLRLFIGTLRDLEVEQLVDGGRGFLADTILFLVFYAPTIDNREVGTVYLIQYICCVIFMKVFHLTTQIRVSHMFEVGIPRFIVQVKLVSLMCLLFCCDVIALQFFYSVASRSSTFFTWILFEALTMSTVVIVSICKYLVHMVDLRLDNGWPGKSVCLFYIDLIHDVLSMTLFLVFMLTFFVQNPSRLPIYMMADVIQVARKLAQRLRSFRRYRRISLNMDMRFPDATDEEIERDEYCVICRDSLFEGSKPKKLPCNHIFHIDCLRSWLVMQQVCPTCRAEISADGPLPTQTAPAAAAVPAVAMANAAQQAAGPAAAAGLTAQAPATAATSIAPGGASAQNGSASHGASSAPPPPRHAHGASPPGISISIGLGGTAPAGASIPCGGGCCGSGAEGQAHGAPQSSGSSVSASTAAAFAGLQRIDLGPASAGAPMATMIMLGGLGSGSPGLPSVNEIVESLTQAEEISKFLREQTEFWMAQVRLIQQDHAQGVSVFSGKGAGMSVVPPHLSSQVLLLGSAGATSSSSSAAAPAPASVVATEAAVPGATQGLAAPEVPADAHGPTASAGSSATTASTPSTTGVAPTVLQSMNEEQDEEQDEAGDSDSGAPDAMAELRKAQQERWKRSGSSLSNTSG